MELISSLMLLMKGTILFKAMQALPGDDKSDHGLPLYAIGDEIPKKIHQCFFGAKEFSEELRANVEAIKGLNPEWQHTLWNETQMKEFIEKTYGPRILSYYNRINPKYGAAKVDLFRYLLLYKTGGVYLDIKSTVLRPIDDILFPEDRYILAQWDNPDIPERITWGKHKEVAHIDGGEFHQWHIICAPGHPFLRAVINSVLSNIDRYVPWRDGTGSNGIFRLTGPIAYSLAIYPILGLHNHRIVNTGEAGLEYSILSKMTHSKIFTSHYYYLTESLVALSPTNKIVAEAYFLAKNLKNFAKKLLKRA